MKLTDIISNISKIAQIQQKSELWYEIKKKLITATEVSTIFNCNPFQTINQLYKEKSHPHTKIDKIINERTEWGEFFESIAKKFFVSRNNSVCQLLDLGLAICPLNLKNYLGASPDGLVIFFHNEQFSFWLIEIKCPYQREMTQSIPYNYWLQMQTQLYIWTLLLKEIGLSLEGCIYCENQFEMIEKNQYDKLLIDSNNSIQIGFDELSNRYYKLNQYWEQKVIFDENFYAQKILPEIQLFKDLIDHPISENKNDSNCNKKRKRSSSSDILSCQCLKKRKLHTHSVFSAYLNNSQITTQKQYRNYINHDTILDWLEIYGNRNQLQLEQTQKLNIKNFVYSQYKKLVSHLYHYIKQKCNTKDYIEISNKHPSINDNTSIHFKETINQKGLCYSDFAETINSLNEGIPIIFNGVLYNPERKKLGYYNIILKYQYLSLIFPMAIKKLKEANINFNWNDYTFIQVKYSKLKLCSENLYLLNQGSQKIYKIEQTHLHQVFNYYQKVDLNNSFIIGRKSNYSTKRITYENCNVLNSIGIFDQLSRDVNYINDINAADQWLHELRKNGHSWSIDPPDRYELLPNMKNNQDSPWSQYKKQLAEKNKDLTKLWYLGNAERLRLWESGHLIKKWDQLDINILKYNQHYKNIIGNIIQSNKHGYPINLNKLKQQIQSLRKNIEFFLDFEFVTDLGDDFSQFPESNSSKFIYMIGMIASNSETSKVTYHNYLINRLDKNTEIETMNHWLQEIDKLNNNQNEITIYHWGAAEKFQLRSYISSQNQLCFGKNEKIVKKINLIDLCELFKNCEVSIPGCFNYGLKDIVPVLYQHKWINSIWPNDLTGEDAMIAAIEAEKECQCGHYLKLSDVPLMNDFIQYNYIDCKVLEEIVKSKFININENPSDLSRGPSNDEIQQ